VVTLFSGEIDELTTVPAKVGWLTPLFLGILGSAIAYLLLAQALSKIEVGKASLFLFAAPIVVTALILVEPQIGFFGILPIVVKPVLVGVLLTVAAIAIGISSLAKLASNETKNLISLQSVQADTTSSTKLILLPLIATTLISILLAGIGLFLPMQVNFIRGVLNSGAPYRAEWQTLGYQVVGGYLLALAGVILLFVSLSFRKNYLKKIAYFALPLFSMLLVLSYVLAGRTRILNWLTWLPAEIQHALGTEYVDLKVIGLTNPFFVLSAVVTTGVALFLLGYAYTTLRTRKTAM
jgi:hypothetical protein